MKYYIFVIFAVLFWSGNFVIGRFISNDIEPIELAFFRWLFVFFIVSPFILFNIKRIIYFIKNHYFILFLQALLGITGFNTLLYYGLQTTTATNALLINSSIPALIVFLSYFIFNSSISKHQTFGITLSTLGVIFLVLKGDISNVFNLEFTKGDFWIILACIDWALYSILLRFTPKDIKPFEFFSITILIGLIFLSILYLFISDKVLDTSFLYEREIFYSILYIVIFPSILSFYFWNISTKVLSANITGQFTHLMPLFGAVMAFFLLGEILYIYHYIGIFLIAIGIYFSTFFKKK
jgi:drug/metabolite transporter (DMT)-like permease